MALLYSDVMAHFNLPELIMKEFMEILLVITQTKERWEFVYDDWQTVRDGNDSFPYYTRANQGQQHVDLR